MRIADKALEAFGPLIAQQTGVDLEQHIEERDGVRWLETSHSAFVKARLMVALKRARARKEQEHGKAEAV